LVGLLFDGILDWLDYYSMASWIGWIIIRWHLGLVGLLFDGILDWLDYYSMASWLDYYSIASWIG